MNVLWETLGFAGKALIVLITFAFAVSILFRARGRRGRPSEGHLLVKRLDEQLRMTADALRGALLPPKEASKHQKELAKRQKHATIPEKRIYVVDFKGDVMASGVDGLRHEINALVAVANEADEVVVRLESPGGAVTGYGLAASQLARLRAHGIPLTVCVDKVAASGGYMMACVADHIVAAPFAIVGSIGVAAPTPNFHRLLDRHGVDFENFTGGKYKRTVSFAAPITEEGRKKYQEQIDETHDLFKDFVKQNRPALDVEEVATGEYWLGTRALELGLVSELMTSDDYLLSKLEEDVALFEVSYQQPTRLRERLLGTAASMGERFTVAALSRAEQLRLG